MILNFGKIQNIMYDDAELMQMTPFHMFFQQVKDLIYCANHSHSFKGTSYFSL
jgi:hypothetical protein